VLNLRLSTSADQADSVAAALRGIEGVRRLVRLREEGDANRVVFLADLEARAADHTVVLLRDLGVSNDDYLIARADIVAPTPLGRPGGTAVAWIELIGQARANSWLIGRYLVLMSVAGVIAALGVITDNPILIVGAMAVSPDLLPICAICVGIVGGRTRLVPRALITLVVGLGLAIIVAMVLSALLDGFGILGDTWELTDAGLGSLASIDYSTLLIAFFAGIAGILAFETRASAAVGVAISVTTIPAAGYLGVSVGAGGGEGAAGALLVLVVNVILLVIGGSLALAVQERRN
jgi:uncharacterized hydrophobic protein (TIGR00271 family)